MQVFKTGRKLFLTNELKSWLITFAIVAIFYFGLQLLSVFAHDKFILGVFIMLFLKVEDTLTQYHVTEIQTDIQINQLTFKLYSFMLGEKVKKYNLEHVSSKLIPHSGLTKFLFSPLTLKISMTPKESFRISSRYGFSTNTLTAVDKIFKES